MTALKIIAAFIVGSLAGGIANMALVMIGPRLIPPPEGVDLTRVESLAASMHLLGPQHFVFPFLAHAVGTLVGALVGYLLAPCFKRTIAWSIGGLTLIGGIAACFMIPAPLWFMLLDLIVAYLPMAWLGIRLGAAMQKRSPHPPRASQPEA